MVDRVRRRAGRPLKVAALAGLTGSVATGCGAPGWLALGWPEGVTAQAERMRELWLWATLASLIVGVIVWGLIAWTVTFHRRRSDAIPRQTQYNLPLEIVYTVIPFVIISVLFYFTVTAQNFVYAQQPDPDLRVRVVGFQWDWEFVYLTDQRQPADERTIYDDDFDTQYVPMQAADGAPVSTVGSSTQAPLLVIPANRTVEYRLFSRDVIHSFFVPEFLFKRDVFPQPGQNDTDNVFQTATREPGAFVGRCAELCGAYHAYMNFEVRALPPAVFGRYLQLRQQLNPVTRQPYTASEALAELNCGRLCAPDALTTKPLGVPAGATGAAPTGADR